MARRLLMAAFIAAGMLFGTSFTLAAKEDQLTAAKCPVSGKGVKAESAVDYKGGKVYFCCDNCPKAFKNDTAKFATKANHQLAVTGQAKQEKCPLTGKDLNPDTAIEVSGAKVAFCCNNCKGKVSKATGQEQIDMVFSDKAFDKAFEVKKK